MRHATSLLVLLLVGAVTAGGFVTGAANAIVPKPPHPWLTPSRMHRTPPPHVHAGICQNANALCPDLAMRPPYGLRPDVQEGHHVLRASNAVLSIGPGPVEIRGFRSTRRGRMMHAFQYVHRKGKPPLRIGGGAGHLVYTLIPGQGRIWKFHDAAKFELWTRGAHPRLVRTGEKLNYCLRDLRHLWSWTRSPKNARYPACSHSSRIKTVTLGTSPGWTDIYPETYYDQWINVDGLRGCFDLVHIADPDNAIIETNEANNSATTRVRLPMGKRNVQRC